MPKRDALSKGLAVVGTVFVWFPIIGTLATSGLMRGFAQIDWLMPAELFPLVAVGGVALLWSAIRSHARRGLVAWGIGIAIGSLAAGMVITTVSGLASGATEPATAGLAWTAALVAIGLYTACIVELGVAGVMLLRDLFVHHGGAMAPAA